MEAGDKKRHREIEKKTSRKEALEKKKAIQNIIKAASLVKDHLSNFPHFRHYRRNGLYAHLESGHGNKMTLHTKQYIHDLLKLNMEAPYGPEWPAEEKIKRREMVSEEARYIFVHEISNVDARNMSELKDKQRTCTCSWDGPIVGFVHYRFILEEEVPVVYVYELQLEPRAQGKGLGRFLMQLIELIAFENRMGAVMLTVQKANKLAMDFYIYKLRYVVSAVSPSRVDPLLGPETSYEILCKTFDQEAQAVLEIPSKKEAPFDLLSYEHIDTPAANHVRAEGKNKNSKG
ncbi:Acetyltransferase (GNAT) domain-containing protein [Handroanthus impetiginosus]|uniref:N-alpha-acetyltransferase 40 n=1 Tax=Handroanthus impetiginosus TaxID=429701 RepID=A0A2G9HWF1_9LAMI|nr:Acetyltransferase (GNAT) domain-containing protein [Handroanthus impetiginosus]